MSEQDPKSIKWLSDEKYATMPGHERALHWASTYAALGVREIGKNDGLFVRLFLKAVGLTPGYAWCAAFVYHCCLKSGIDPKKLPARWKAARVSEWVAWARSTARTRQAPKRGHLAYTLNANGTGHIEFVRNVELWPESFNAIGGNTSDPTKPSTKAQEREGDGVYYKKRTRVKFELYPESGFITLEGL